MTTIAQLPRIATIATLARREDSFRQMLPTILGQVQHTFVALGGYPDVPAFLRGLERVSVFLCDRGPDLGASSRFLCLEQLPRPAVVLVVDDDILYPPDYAERMAHGLAEFDGEALLGVHGRIFMPPHASYSEHAFSHHFQAAVDGATFVHEVGAGTCAFLSTRLAVDPRGWDRYDMDDIVLAIEAQKRGLPRIVVERRADWLRPLAEDQDDSLFRKMRADDSEQSRRMRLLLSLYRAGQDTRQEVRPVG
jgi:hypothetical protein